MPIPAATCWLVQALSSSPVSLQPHTDKPRCRPISESQTAKTTYALPSLLFDHEWESQSHSENPCRGILEFRRCPGLATPAETLQVPPDRFRSRVVKKSIRFPATPANSSCETHNSGSQQEHAGGFRYAGDILGTGAEEKGYAANLNVRWQVRKRK